VDSMRERRSREWECRCSSGRLHSQSCLKCLRCGKDQPDPVTLGRACHALGVYLRAIADGYGFEEAMRQALEADSARRGDR
jgi:hypothetical protein